MEAGWSTTTRTAPCLALSLAKTSRSLGSLLGSRLANAFFPAGVTAVAWCALADVQAEEGADVADVDHVLPPVVLTRPSHGTDRHIHITKSLPTCGQAGGHAPDLLNRPQTLGLISGLSMPPEPVTPPPRPCVRQGEKVMPAPEAGRPVAGPPKR